MQSREEKLEAMRKYHLENKEKIAAQRKEYRERKKEEIKEKKAKYYLDNIDKIKEKHQEYALSHKEEKSEYDKKLRQVKGDELRDYSRIYRINNRESLNKKAREKYEYNREDILAVQKEYYNKNKEEILSKRRVKISRASGAYNPTLAERNKDKWLTENIFFYKIELKEEDGTVFYKYGLTVDLMDRFRKIPYEINIIETIFINKYDGVYLEIERLKNVEKYIPNNKFKGYTECFII